jgi:hypothetical protein
LSRQRYNRSVVSISLCLTQNIGANILVHQKQMAHLFFVQVAQFLCTKEYTTNQAKYLPLLRIFACISNQAKRLETQHSMNMQTKTEALAEQDYLADPRSQAIITTESISFLSGSLGGRNHTRSGYDDK